MSRETSRGRRPFKVWDSSRVSRKALVVSSLEELIVRGREKLGVGGHESVKAVLELDGTQVDDSEYFRSLPDNTVFLLLRPGERWCPAGVDVIRAALSSIPRIVCEAISSLDLSNEVPSWKIMESRGRITIVLTWDQRPSLPGPHHHSAAHAPPLSTTHSNAAFLRRQSPISSNSVSPQPPTATTSLGGGGLSSRLPMMGGVRTMVGRDGKLETTINGRGGLTPSITVISHEESPYDSVPMSRGSRLPPPLPPYGGGGALPPGHPYQYSMRGLPRQGSSSESTATAPIHVHTVECADRGHLPPHPPHGSGGRGSPPDSSYCDFHCCALHEEGRKIQVHKTLNATSPIDLGGGDSGGRHPFPLPTTAAAAAKLHVRFMGVGEDRNGRGVYVSKKLLSVPPSALTATTLAGAHQHTTPQPPSNHAHLPGFPHHSRSIGDPGGGDLTTTTESSESETEGNSTLLEDDPVTSSKFLLLIDQLSLDQKRHLTIKDIGVILDRLSSKIVDVERLSRESEARDCFNWTIKATIRGNDLRELGVIYNGNFYAISEHPAYRSNSPLPPPKPRPHAHATSTREEYEEEDMRL